MALARPRLAATAAIIGIATAAIVWLMTYVTLTPAGRMWNHGDPRGFDYREFVLLEHSTLTTSPTWTAPVAALIGIAAIGSAVLMLRRPPGGPSSLPPV